MPYCGLEIKLYAEYHKKACMRFGIYSQNIPFSSKYSVICSFNQNMFITLILEENLESSLLRSSLFC